jgi:hypothetical protein
MARARRGNPDPPSFDTQVAVAREARLRRDLQAVLATVEGLRVLGWLVDDVGRLYGATPEGELGQRAIGRREAALELRQRIKDLDEAALPRMAVEVAAVPVLMEGLNA